MTSESTFSEQAAPGQTAKSQPKNDKVKLTHAEPAQRKYDGRTLLHGHEPAPGEVKVVMSQLALRQVEGHSGSDLTRELGGVLLGKSTQSGTKILVNVMAAIPVRSGDHGPVHFTFSADTWAQLHRDREEKYPHLDVVGWYHTHPDLGVFFSADDIVVHSAAFVLPWQIGMVLDPARREVCLVGWNQKQGSTVDRELAGLPGFYEKLDHQENSVVTWRFSLASIWRQGGYLPQNPADIHEVYTPPTEWPSLPQISPWWGVALGGLSLLISLLLLLERILGGA